MPLLRTPDLVSIGITLRSVNISVLAAKPLVKDNAGIITLSKKPSVACFASSPKTDWPNTATQIFFYGGVFVQLAVNHHKIKIAHGVVEYIYMVAPGAEKFYNGLYIFWQRALNIRRVEGREV